MPRASTSVGDMIVDAHHHLWDLGRNRYPWLQAEPDPEAMIGDYAQIRRDYLATDFAADCAPAGVVRSVHVQAEWDPDDPVGETRWLQQVSDQHGFPHGIVAAARLEDANVDELLEAHAAFANMRGIRQMLDRGDGLHLISRPDWERGLERLTAYGLSFDLQVNPDQLIASAALAERHPDLIFILNHCGMPQERTPEGLELWRAGLRRLAGQPIVSAKVSGLGMFDHAWSVGSIRPYVEEMLEVFGVERCLFGSNFPVDRLYSSYPALVEAYRKVVDGLSAGEQHAFFYENAVRVYRL
jgi:predicted TIM-barrel fold metal-dependent hydrolase